MPIAIIAGMVAHHSAGLPMPSTSCEHEVLPQPGADW